MSKPHVVDEYTRSRSKGTKCTAEEGRTRQEDAQRADINYILARVSEGILPVPKGPAVYADVSNIGDFRTQLENVKRGERAFASLDAEVRSAFDNDVSAFVEAFESEEGIAKLRGLKVVPETEETLADRREAASEARAEKRREARELEKRVEAARRPPPVV